MNPPSGKEFCKELLKAGWVLERITGSHHIFGKPGVDVKLSVPVHGNRPLKVGTWRALKVMAGM